ncbi:hypothetical protein CVIRNUC_010645 [Coccomyxa viridis]|uniref:AAA+ ATPase domain-containing protein n=1 Tax=Coccomyxa viridis TaxID=1274662 RepID=A0AAV1IMF0_9CHLO|nr:hypothetical protein CVIRNUC_010645 [Coccomyxa viridis]
MDVVAQTQRQERHLRKELLVLAAAGEASAEVPKASSQSKGGVTPDRWLFEPVHGLPIVRKQLKYAELLKEIRMGHVRTVMYFDNDESAVSVEDYQEVEGPCLVVFNDNRVAHSYVPRFDYRIPYAMETHGVEAARLATPLTSTTLQQSGKVAGAFTARFLSALPFLALGLAYLATQYAAYLKGDLEDRKKIQSADVAREKELKAQRDQDERLLEARKLAGMGLSVDEIEAELKRIKMVGYSREYIERLVEVEQMRAEDARGIQYEYNTEEAEQRQAAEEAAKSGDDANDLEKAQDFGRLRTMKVQQAVVTEEEEEEMRVRMRQAQRQMKGTKLQYIDQQPILFSDVAGVPGAKEELLEVVDFFLKPQRFRRSGAKIPRGILLCGPPGTGKTLLARAVAGEAGVAFLSLNASEFVEMFVGVGASRVRDLFAQARSLAPAIIFIDEIDAVGRTRGGAQGNDERDQTLNQMLSEMDGFQNSAQVIVMAATNRQAPDTPLHSAPKCFQKAALSVEHAQATLTACTPKQPSQVRMS